MYSANRSIPINYMAVLCQRLIDVLQIELWVNKVCSRHGHNCNSKILFWARVSKFWCRSVIGKLLARSSNFHLYNPATEFCWNNACLACHFRLGLRTCEGHLSRDTVFPRFLNRLHVNKSIWSFALWHYSWREPS